MINSRDPVPAEARIMLVEDDASMTQELESLLTDLGYSIVGQASSGEEALMKVEKINPDLIIMDVGLRIGGLDGVDTAKKIYQGFGIPSLFLTAHADDKTLGRIKESKAFGYVSKPFDQKEFMTVLEIALVRCRQEKILISSRKKAEDQVLKLSEAVEQSANIVMITDREGKIEYVNSKFTAVTGYKREEALGQTPRILKSGKHNSEFYHQIWKTVLGGKSWHGEVTNRRKDGKFYKEDMLVSPLFDKSGQVTHFIAIKQDITERKVMEEQYRRTQRMESMGMLVGGIVHDFNNYLTIMKGYVEIIARTDGAEKEKIVTEMREATSRTQELARQLMIFSRREVRAPAVCSANFLIIGMEKMLGLLATKEVLLEFVLEKNLWLTKADAGQLEQVLVNITANARDAMPNGGGIVIETKNVTVEEPEGPTFLKGDYVVISVSDTGSGMSAEVREHLFEPFFTTKPEGKGTGLGLATAYGIIRQHNGFIHVESEPGVGSVFKIYLPRFIAPAPAA